MSPLGAGSTSTPSRMVGGSGRQFVRFAFYRSDPSWRRLSAGRQKEQKQELAAGIRAFGRRMLLRPYSLLGTRADVELLLWQVADRVDLFHELASEIARTQMGGYLSLSASYLSQTKRSIYEIRDEAGGDVERLVISPSEARYLFVYPFLKTRGWYKLPMEERQRMMDEHISVGRKYPSVKLNTTYSFGLDDQEFVVAFETDEPGDFLDLVQELRGTDASLYTLRDTPLYTCINMSLEASLDAMGGLPIAGSEAALAVGQDWHPVCAADELGIGQRRIAYAGGQQVAVFNLEGRLYAIGNRCSHARGPLAEGEVDSADCSVTCPWHYAKFDLRTGEVLDGVAASGVPSYAVEVREGMVCIRPPQQPPAMPAAATEAVRA